MGRCLVPAVLGSAICGSAAAGAVALAPQAGGGQGGRESVAAFLDEFRALPSARANFDVVRVDGVRTSVASKALKRGSVIARTPAQAVVGANFSRGHRLLAEKCAASGEGFCASMAFAAAALWLCTCELGGEHLACGPYARMLPGPAELLNFPSFSRAQRAFLRRLEPELASSWLQNFAQLEALVAASAPGLKKLGLELPHSPGAARADGGALQKSLWWALGVASTRAMVLPTSMAGVGHVNMALFPALDMFNLSPNNSLANAEYQGMDLVATRRLAKGEQVLLPRNAKLATSPLESFANQGFRLQEMQDGPEIKVQADRVPYDAERAERFGCSGVPGHFRRPAEGRAVFPAETLACLHVMWYPLPEAERALATGHLRHRALPAALPPTAVLAAAIGPPTRQELGRWQRLDAEAFSYLSGLCQEHLKGTREALASTEARKLKEDATSSISRTLLDIAEESAEVYKRCRVEVSESARRSAGKGRARKRPASTQRDEV